jgi:hypothetical protein
MSGREKGLAFEIQIARMLSKWTGSSSDIFWRSPGSGSVGINDNKGDIISIKEGNTLLDYVSIECKFYKTFDLLSLVDKTNNKSNPFISFWQQCVKASKQKVPLLIVKRNYGKILLITRTNVLSELSLKPRITFYIENDLLGIVHFESLLNLDFESTLSKFNSLTSEQ